MCFYFLSHFCIPSNITNPLSTSAVSEPPFFHNIFKKYNLKSLYFVPLISISKLQNTKKYTFVAFFYMYQAFRGRSLICPRPYNHQHTEVMSYDGSLSHYGICPHVHLVQGHPFPSAWEHTSTCACSALSRVPSFDICSSHYKLSLPSLPERKGCCC